MDAATTNREDLSFLMNKYQNDALVQLIIEQIKKNEGIPITLKGLSGGLKSLVPAAVYALHSSQSVVFVLQDKEEAAYFNSDIQQLLPSKEVLFFPTSYKKPYQFVEVENANVLQRTEVLSSFNDKGTEGKIIVTYPEALTEKVINQRSLVKNSFGLKVGENVSIPFIQELLLDYQFELTDFVYEPGQFAIRGGIIDIFSYAHEYPYRIEFFGDDAESIRTFDPLTQLSTGELSNIVIIPDLQTKLLQEVRESFFSFLPSNTLVWTVDFALVMDTINVYYDKVKENFEALLKDSGQTQIVDSPEALFETVANFKEHIKKHQLIEIGPRFYFKKNYVVTFNASPQPPFHKDFMMVADNLRDNSTKGLTNIIVSDSERQLGRIHKIFQEIAPDVTYQEMIISMGEGFVDYENHLACYTDHQIFERYHHYIQKKKFSKTKAMTLKEMKAMQIGDYVTHIEYGIGRFGGIEKLDINGKLQEAIRLIFRDEDLLYISIHALHKISRYSTKDGKVPQMNKLGSQEWENKKKKVKKKVKDIAAGLIKLYAKRRTAKGYTFSEDSYLQAELESSFIYQDTPDQAKASQDVKEDMEKSYPMDRLVCGDVGFGKTEVAIRAAFKAVCDSKQVAILVPTTILAYQHYKTFKERLKGLPCTVDYINRFRTNKEIKETLKKVSEGQVDILIGTHRITSKDVGFKDLGLMIIDEEQKFGVKTKEKLKEFKIDVDVLTLTATPIPRTLQFSMMGARDLSVINTPPPNRQPVTTEIHTFSEEFVRDAVRKELQRGGQVFFVHNRVSDIIEIANVILNLVPDAKVAYAHGQMEGPKLEKIMMKFVEGEYDVLVSTNIIESGLDIPNANTIIINRAHQFGLSDLHQMRGRVGRSNRKAYCYLLSPPAIHLPGDARKRLSTLEQFTELGDGIKVAMRDLDIRGAGDVLGGEQSGFISDLGFDTYNKILDDAVAELKESEFKELFANDKKSLDLSKLVVDCQIETDLEILIPEDYVSNISERLNVYVQADELKTDEDLVEFEKMLKDRFGPIPSSVEDLLITVRLRWKAEKLGMEKVVIKNNELKAYLLPQNREDYYQSETFGKILAFIQTAGNLCQLKEYKDKLLLKIKNISSVEQAISYLDKILT